MVNTNGAVPVQQLLKKLPAFSAVAVKLMLLIADENVSFREVARLFSLDPVLAGQILRLANSGMYGRQVEIQSVLQAVAVLGLKNISRIAIAASLGNCLPKPASPWIREWWRHSIAAALTADRAGLELDFGYTAGLLHSVGRLALYRHSPEEYPELVDTAHRENLDVLSCEREQFGVDHAELSGLILARWGLPKGLQAAASKYHLRHAIDPLTAAVQAGCYYAECGGFGRCGGLYHRSKIAAPLAEKNLDEFLVNVLAIEVNRLEIEWALA